jgi:hypothetical protein
MPAVREEPRDPIADPTDVMAASLYWLDVGLGHVGGLCDALPAWPGGAPATPADVYALHAQALDLADLIDSADCPCHTGIRGRDALEITARWRTLADHAVCHTGLHPRGTAEDNRRRRIRVADCEADFRAFTQYLFTTRSGRR